MSKQPPPNPQQQRNMQYNQYGKKPYFADKKILITGASSGLGRSLAYWYYFIHLHPTWLTKVNVIRYLNNGAQVALIGRDIKSLSEIGEKFPS